MITDGVPTFGSVVLLAMSLGFVGCSDDDDNKPKGIDELRSLLQKKPDSMFTAYLKDLLDVAMVFAVSLMVAMVLNMNMAEMFFNESFTIVKNPGKENIPLYAEEAIPHKSVRSEPLFPHKSVVNRQLFPHKSVVNRQLFPHKSVVMLILFAFYLLTLPS